jgi:hypothetical protein
MRELEPNEQDFNKRTFIAEKPKIIADLAHLYF